MAVIGSLKTVLLETEDELYQISGQWQQLQAMTKRTTVFQSWEWCYSWWEVFAESYDRLAVVCVYDHDELVMILPLTIKKDDEGNSTFFLLGYGFSDYDDFIVKAGYEQSVRRVLADVMKQNNISMIHGRFTPPWSSLYQIVVDLNSGDIRQKDVHLWLEKCPQVRWQEKYAQVILPATWEEYLYSCKKGHRKDMRRALRKATDFGLVLDYDDRPSPSIISMAIDVHCQSTTRRGLKSPFREPDNRRFIECAYQRLFAADKARLFTLKDRDILVGFDIVLKDQTWFYSYMTGMHGNYLKLSPGVASLANVLRVAIAEGLYGVDLLLGDEGYKDRWTRFTITAMGINIMFSDVEYVSTTQRITRSIRGRVKLRTRVRLVKDFFRQQFLEQL